jgi:hypothetical protein
MGAAIDCLSLEKMRCKEATEVNKSFSFSVCAVQDSETMSVVRVPPGIYL